LVRLRHSRIHAEDCESCETKQGMLDRIDSEIELSGALSAEQRLGRPEAGFTQANEGP